MGHYWSLNKWSSMNKLTQHADSLQTLQAKMHWAALRNKIQSFSEIETKRTYFDKCRAMGFQIITYTWETTWKTFSQPIWDTPFCQHFPLWLVRWYLSVVPTSAPAFKQATPPRHVLASKKPLEFDQILTEGVQLMFVPEPDNRRRSLNQSPRRKHHNRFVQRVQNSSTPSTQYSYKNLGTRSGSASLHLACKLGSPAENKKSLARDHPCQS